MTATYDSIATTTLSSASNSITFSNIPSTYTDLRLVFVPVGVAVNAGVYIRFNGITTSTYSSTHLYGTGTSAFSGRATNQTYIYANFAGSVSTTQPTLWTMDLFSYAGSTNKTALLSSAQDLNGSGNVTADVGLWRSTAAINSINISSQNVDGYAIGTTATLYGITRE